MKHCIEITLRVQTPWQIPEQHLQHTGEVACRDIRRQLKEAHELRALLETFNGCVCEGGNELGKAWVARVERLQVTQPQEAKG